MTPLNDPTSTTQPSIAMLQRVLDDLAQAVQAFSDEQYVQSPRMGSSGAVGEHVRHVLDHHRALLEGIAGGRINYDQRERGTSIETHRPRALDEIARLQQRVAALEVQHDLQMPLSLCVLVHPHQEPLVIHTTLEREMVFVLSHSIHHHAIIAMAAAHWSVRLPRYFGFAPATIRHLEQQACAPSAS